MHNGLLALVSILVLGLGAQWLAWRLRVPSILLLLVFGVLAGPVAGLIDPDALFGDLLFDGVSLAVGVILFEGGLSLRVSELRTIGGVVWRLCLLGALVTWVLAGWAAHSILGLDVELAVLLGAVLVVTGPTVIVPMLRQLRLADPAASILRWEGILIDPVGAVLAVLVFEGILAGTVRSATAVTLLGLAKAVFIGTAIGVGAAVLLGFVLRRYYLPDFLRNPVSLAAVGTVLVAANAVQHESGILAVTVMGVALGAQSALPVHAILEFKENLRVLFISTLFIVLAARLDLAELAAIVGPGMVFLAFLVIVVRPAAVLVSTARSELTTADKLLLMSMAPRGIVAAAVASIFSLRLGATGIEEAAALVPLTFFTITGTIVVYAIAAPIVARLTGLASRSPQGILFVGAHPWCRQIAVALQDAGFKVVVADTNYVSVRRARMQGLSAYYGSVLSERADADLELSSVGRVLAVTANDEANALVALHFTGHFDRSELYQLAPGEAGSSQAEVEMPTHLRGRILFDAAASYSELSRRFATGAVVKSTQLSDEFGMDAYRELYGDSALPMFLIDGDSLAVFASDNPPTPKPGQTIVALVNAAGHDPAPQGDGA